MLTLHKLDDFIQELLDLPTDRHSKSPQAVKIVRSIFKVLVDALRRGEEVSINGLGRFIPVKFKAHRRPGGSVKILERRPDGTFTKFVNSQEDPQLVTCTKIFFIPSGRVTAALNIDSPATLNRKDRRFVQEVPDVQAD